MPLANVNDIHRVVREKAFEMLPAGTGLCFSLYQPFDAGPEQLGELFDQNNNFLMIEVRIDDVVKSGPGKYTLNRVFGALEIAYHSKDRLDMIGAHHLLETTGKWYAQKTIDGVRFREFVPTGDGGDRGFQVYSCTVIFDFETPPDHN